MNTVKMRRNDELADVHPDEVDNFKLAGWGVVDQELAAKPKKAKNMSNDDKAEHGINS